MSLVEHNNPVDKIEVVGEHKFIYVRSATWVEKDGVIFGEKQFSRHVVTPNSDLSSEHQDVKDIAATVHTEEIKNAYQAFLEGQE